MKRFLVHVLIVTLLFSLFSSFALAESVAVQEQDNLEVSLSTGKQEYSGSDTIAASLSFRNLGDKEIRDIAYRLISPEGYLANGQTGELPVGSLGPGASVKKDLLLAYSGASIPQTGDSFPLYAVLTALCVSGVLLALLTACFKKSCHRMLSLFLCVVLLSSTFGFVPGAAKAASFEKRTMIVEKMIAIDGVSTPIKVLVTYSVNVPYSRAEWIDILLRDAGIAMLDLDTVPYADIANTRYQRQIETAVALGILTPVSPAELFRPDDPATRDFAAAMAVRVLGFITNPNAALNAADASQIEYPAEAKAAIDLSMLSLENGLYVPQRALTEAEASSIRAAGAAVLASTTVTEDGGEGITYQPNVLTVTATDYSDQGNKLTIPASALPADAQIGSIIVLNGNKSYRILGISENGSQVTIQYEEPELAEVIQEIDAHGFLHGSVEDFIPAEDVTVTRSITRAGNASSGLLGSLKLSGSKTLRNGSKFFYEVSVSVPDASFNFDANILTMNFKNVYASISPEITGEFTWGTDYERPAPQPKERFFLGSVPLFGIHGAGVLLEFYIAVEAEGKIGVEVDMNALMGFQIYNNQPRAFGDLDLDIVPMLSGKVAVGPNFYLVGQLLGKNLISFGGFLAAYFEGSAKWRIEEGTCCLDGGLGVLLEIDMGDCLAKKLPALKNSDLTWEILKHALWSGHIEATSRGLNVVPECTLNQGTLRGIVAHATNRTNYVSGAQITLTDANGRVKTETSGSTGGYTIVTKEGDYTLKVSKSGYIPFEMDITIVAGDTNVVETLLMVEGSENDSRTGTIGGKITNAKTGESISGVTIEIRKGWKKTTGAVVQTVYSQSNGQYEATLPLGNYTLTLKKDGFVQSYINVAVPNTTDRTHHGSMLPSNGSSGESPRDRLSVVLTWGENPRDLDSHMRGYSAQGSEMFHTYYSNKQYYVNSGKQVFLDLDDTSSYGPETTTVMGMKNGEVYSFFVHDFTNRSSSSSNAMANSGAKVSVYRGVELLKEFSVPAKTGTVWHVFDYNVSTDTITTVNTFTSTGNAGQVGSRTANYAVREAISPDKE